MRCCEWRSVVKLYYTPGACSLAPHIILREGGFHFELEKVDLASKKTESGENFLLVSPRGYVPALLLDDGDVLTETAVIVQYIADLRPESGLVPASGTRERYRLQEWLNFITAEVHKGLSPLWDPALPEAAHEFFRQSVARKFSFLDAHLDGNEYMLGNKFSVADSYAFAIINWKGFFNIDLSPWPNLAAYYDRIAARPFVQAAMSAEGLLEQ